MTSPEETRWSADTIHPDKTAALREAWAQVMDPELSLNILQLGLIREVNILEDGATVRMILTTPFCPYGPALMENARQKAEQVLVIPVSMEYGEEAWDPSMMDPDVAPDWGMMF